MRLRHGFTAGAIAAACVAAGVAVGGCGAANVAGNVIDPVARAATVSNQAPGMRMVFSMRISSPAFPAPLIGTGAGTIDTAKRSGSVNAVMDLGNLPQAAQALGSSTLRMQEILDGVNIYLKFPPPIAGSSALHGKPWAKINLARAAQAAGIPGLSSLMSNPTSSDPSQFLRYLRATSGDVRKVGSESVDGFQTTHYRAQIQLDRAPAVLPPASRAQARQTISAIEQLAHIHDLPVNVWVDRQHLVRRMEFSINETISGQSLSVAMRMDVPEYGPQPAPRLPPANDVIDLTGGLGTSTASGGGSASG